MQNDQDPLAPARGIANGIAIGAILIGLALLLWGAFTADEVFARDDLRNQEAVSLYRTAGVR